ncbi:MAG: metallophosphoesterase family protein [Burkholderiales bacterium]|nr:metallophosphoesterase family protein [Burkholderiales bacterium]
MRIAFVSDIHGNLPALEAVLADIARRGVDRIINLGDHLSGPLWPAETADFLMRQDWLQLAGNHERQLRSKDAAIMEVSDLHAARCIDEPVYAWLHSLRDTARFEDVQLCHGTPTSDLTYFFETVTPAGARLATAAEIAERLGTSDARLVACGHTHMPRMMRDAAGRLLVNPGSVGLPAYRDGAPYDHVIENGGTDTRYAIVERSAEEWTGSLIAVPYDFEAAAKQAAINDRPDWAHALRTGYAPQ